MLKAFSNSQLNWAPSLHILAASYFVLANALATSIPVIARIPAIHHLHHNPLSIANSRHGIRHLEVGIFSHAYTQQTRLAGKTS